MTGAESKTYWWEHEQRGCAIMDRRERALTDHKRSRDVSDFRDIHLTDGRLTKRSQRNVRSCIYAKISGFDRVCGRGAALAFGAGLPASTKPRQGLRGERAADWEPLSFDVLTTDNRAAQANVASDGSSTHQASHEGKCLSNLEQNSAGVRT